MLCRALLTILGVWCCLFATAQQLSIEPLLKAWRVSDTSQTHRAEETYARLKTDRNYAKYQQEVREIEKYLTRHPDDRLAVRLAMYKTLGKFEYHRENEITRQDSLRMEACLGLIERLDDEQLKAEFYTIYGRFRGGDTHGLFMFKALELQRKIGFERFSYVYNRLFIVSQYLYYANDYKQSIHYGRECLKFKDIERKYWDPMVYVFQLDILGAAYLKLEQYDSTRYYYRQIIDTLQRKPLNPSDQQLWMGIAQGNIGYSLILEGREEEGLPMVRLYLEDSRAANSYNNMAIAQNILAGYNLKKRQYAEALALGQKAAFHSDQGSVFDQKVLATKIIADAYRGMGRLDSAIKYYERYHLLRAEQVANQNAGKLSAMNARIAFDDMQHAFQSSRKQLEKEKQARNFILVGIVLLAIISLLLYSRQRLKARHEAELIGQERKQAEKEIEQAREQVRSSMRSILEKEKLISDLRKKIRANIGTDGGGKGPIGDGLFDYVLLTDSDWARFRQAFDKAYPLFFDRLRELVPLISPAEERLASLVFLQLDNKQIADMLGIGADSVARGKRRLKARIDLPAGAVFEEYILTLNE